MGSKGRRKLKKRFQPDNIIREMQERVLEAEESAPVEVEKGIIGLGDGVKIRLPQIEGLIWEMAESEVDGYVLYRPRSDKKLFIWLDIDDEEKRIDIGDKDYRLQGDKLIEIKEGRWVDLYRSIPVREFPLMKDEKGETIIDLRLLTEGNEKVRKFLEQ